MAVTIGNSNKCIIFFTFYPLCSKTHAVTEIFCHLETLVNVKLSLVLTVFYFSRFSIFSLILALWTSLLPTSQITDFFFIFF